MYFSVLCSAFYGNCYSNDRIPVVNRYIEQGEIIEEKYIDYINQDVDSRKILTSASDIVSKLARCDLNPYMPIYASSIKESLAIKQGDTVNIEYQNNGVFLNVKGTALESGHAGSCVKVRNDRSGEVLFVRVVDLGKVAIEA